MSTVVETLARAKAFHQAGQLRDAEELCRRVLETDSGNAEAHYLLAATLHSLGRANEAITSLSEALRLQPDYVEAHNHLGIVLAQQGKLDDAALSFQQAWRLRPASAEISRNLRFSLAAKDNSLGNAMAAQKKLDEAAACYRRALELHPDFAAAHYGLAAVLRDQAKLDDAAACYRRGLELKPDFVEGHANLGAILAKQGQLDEAAACYRRTLELKPDYAEVLINLGALLEKRGQFDEAVACWRRALELKPDFAEAHNNLGAALEKQDKLDEAAACYRRAIELKPDFAEAHNNLASTLLLMGRLDEGWLEYEWRWNLPVLKQPPRSQPAWDGSPLAGRTLLVYTEQGLGDTLQFIRYVPLLESQGAKVIVEVQEALLPLLSGSGFSGLVPRGAPLPCYDLHAALLTLPGLFKTTLASIPGGVPYLSADAALVEHWRRKLDDAPGFKVGIQWQGSRSSPRPDRAIPLSAFERIAKLAGVRLVSLQKGFGCQQIALTADHFSILDFGPQLDEASGPFMDTAALMTQLDLVITSDTSTAHLAGGLGVPVWLALPYASCWRWLRVRTDSPWYPTMRLFRQDRPADWDDVFQRIEKELADLMGRNGC